MRDGGDVHGASVHSPGHLVFCPLSRNSGGCRVGPGASNGRFLGFSGDWRSLGNWEREAAELASAGDANAPGQLGFVARALVTNFEALGAIRPPAVALDVAF